MASQAAVRAYSEHLALRQRASGRVSEPARQSVRVPARRSVSGRVGGSACSAARRRGAHQA